MEVKLAALANAATDTATGTVQPAISPEMSMNDDRGLARKRAGGVLADLTPLVLVGG